MSGLEEPFNGASTNVTHTVHRGPYPAISPRPELSQAGKVVLITGGGTGVGFAIARAFVRSSADTVIILGRRAAVLEKARSRLEDEAKSAGTGTKIIKQACDIVISAEVDTLWKGLKDQGIIVDVFVSNAAKFSEPKPMLELGTEEVWSQMEMNVKSPLYFTEKFCSQGSEKQKFIVNISTAAIHMASHPGIAACPAYTLSKLSGTLLFQLLAQDIPPERVQIISFNPGLIYNEYWESTGSSPQQFDNVSGVSVVDELCGTFAVWTATKEAAFLHGRFVWSSWDVTELATGELRKRLDEDPYYLKASIVGLRGGSGA